MTDPKIMPKGQIYKSFEEWHEEICEECYRQGESGIEATYIQIEEHLKQAWEASRREPEQRIKRALDILCDADSLKYEDLVEAYMKACRILNGGE